MLLKAKPESAEEAEGTTATRLDLWTRQIIGAAIEVHRHGGPGLLESAYEECLCFELSQLGLHFKRQVPLPVSYKGIKLDSGYKMDLVVEDAVVLELKTVDQLLPIHSAQFFTYLKLSGKPVGLLINFNEPVLKKGLKRLVNHFRESLGAPVPSAAWARESGEDARAGLSLESLKTRRLGVSAVK
jgi:GxxExxY protein